ncbi:hypothetical protein ACOMCU_22380 [Lysinibacillus sp. UGB7]|uniref:hypothetical protein n=1 Tax=Lysinibacillus sp. UGB7 TaxID=3411039 RepID=UPI003B813C89
MNSVLLIGTIGLGIISIGSVILCYKSYREHTLKNSADYLDNEPSILEGLKKENCDVEESSFRKAVTSFDRSEHDTEGEFKPTDSLLRKAIASSNRNDDEEKVLKSSSSLRNAAVSFNKREREKGRSNSNEGWNTTPNNNLFATSYLNDTTNEHCNKGGSTFDSGASDFGSNVSSSNDSMFSSSNDSSSSYSGGGDSGGGGYD